jgi:hypothetical protein
VGKALTAAVGESVPAPALSEIYFNDGRVVNNYNFENGAVNAVASLREAKVISAEVKPTFDFNLQKLPILIKRDKFYYAQLYWADGTLIKELALPAEKEWNNVLSNDSVSNCRGL